MIADRPPFSSPREREGEHASERAEADVWHVMTWHRYVDEFAAVLREYKHVPVAVIIEPDSLGNLVASVRAPAISRDLP